jgi:PKD repeat protein
MGKACEHLVFNNVPQSPADCKKLSERVRDISTEFDTRFTRAKMRVAGRTCKSSKPRPGLAIPGGSLRVSRHAAVFAGFSRRSGLCLPACARALLWALTLILPVLLTGCGGGPGSIHVSLSNVSAQLRLQPGSAAQITLSPSLDGFKGTINLGQTTVTFTDPSGNAQSSTPTAQSGSNPVTLTFNVPAVAPTTATTYQVTVQGSTSENQTFSSLEPIAAVVYPAPVITLVPASSYQGQTVTVAITGVNTDFSQGLTQANFGAGIAVNGAGAGLPGVINVTAAGSATASLVISPTATIGARAVVVTTQSQTGTLNNGFTVQAALLPLVASAGGPYTGFTGRSVTFTGSGSNDPNGLTLSYAWNFGDGTTGTGVQPTHTYAKAGAFTVQLTVSDSANLSATASTTATIATLVNPTAVAGGPYTGTTGQAVSFNGAGSTDPNGSTLTYAWSFGDGSTGSGATPTHTYATAQTYSATLSVTDTYGLTGSATATVTIGNPIQPPTANAGGPYTGTAGTAITFNGSGSTDPQGQTLTYAWDFGDGTTGTGVRPTHTYAAAGTYTVRLTVTNTSNLTGSATATATIAAAPKPPTAVAGGPYTGTAGTAVSFNGSGSSDPQGQTLTYAWAFGDGGTGTGATPSHTYAAAGTYTVSLTVTDTSGLTGSATATATIAATPKPPTAVAGGPYTGTVGTAVSFNGSASSDPQGQTLTYAWAFGDGSNGTGATPTHTYTTAGTYTATLTVTDTSGLTGSATATVTISAAPKAPTAVAGGPYTGMTGTAVTFNGSASTDPQGQTLTYAWAFGDGGTGTGATPTHIYTTAGTYTATLTVTDTSGLTGTATATVTISATPKPPTAVAGGPYTGLAGTAVSFNGSGSTDPQSQTLTYAWSFGDGGTGAGATPTHTYASAGTYTATLTVTDTSNLTGSATATVVISAAPKAPTAVAGGPYTGVAGTAVSFNGSASSDPQGQTLTYAWSFGDGSNGSGPTPTHTYAAAGTYTATLTVTDASNLTGSATATVTITAAQRAPTAVAGGPYTGTAGTAVSFNGTGSTGPQGQTLTYAWSFGDGGTGSGASPTHIYTTAGTFTATLTVTDTSNLSGSATATVTISAAQTAPTANAGGPYTGNVGQTITFKGSGSSDPEGETLTYAWDFGDGNTGTGVSPTHAYTDAEVYTVTLTVTNTDGATASATTTATINSVLQAVQGGPYTGNVGQTLAFNGTASTAPGSDQLTYAWTFGDGGTANGAQVTYTYQAAGTYNVVLTVTDTTTSLTNSSTTTATITAPPQLAFTSPTQGALFNTTTIQVAGTAGSTVQTVTVNGVTATLSGGTFSATIPVRAGVNILTAAGTDNKGNVGTASTSVTVDLSPPIVSVLQPVNGSTVTTQQITVAGMVTDQVTGTVNSNNVTVTVNGQAAAVSNRSFLVSNLLLVPGANTLNIVATDAAGNTSTSSVQVNLASGTAQQNIVILSGNAQSGQINSVLPQPLVVQLVSPTGTPVPSRAVTFTVTASDGTVESLPLQAQTLNLTTDAQGKASVLFQLGSRAGLGINQVAVTSPGFLGGTVFTETTTAGPPAYIHEFMGNNQRGIIGQPLAEGFQVIVQDAGGDPVAGVPVTYTVNTGDGLFSGQATQTVTTNSDGRAMATLTLGQQEGINNNTVTVDFANDTNAPVNFYASGFSSGNPANTSVSGLVLDNAQNPVPNATASLLNTGLMTTTDVNGHFVINNVPVGTQTLLVDGSTTTLAETLPSLSFILQALPGQNNTINAPVYLPILDTSSAQTVGGSLPVTLTMSSLPGVALTVAPNSVTFPDGTHVGQLTVSQVKSDLIPMQPPNGVVPAFAWTIQPAGTIFSTPISITIPNTQGLPPGQVQEFYQYDHDLEQFVSVGTLRVSPDGSVLNSDPGFGVTKAGWATLGSNPPPGGCGNSCDDNNVCTTDTQANNCSCTHTPKGGGCGGGGSSPGANNCQQPGKCVNGACSAKPRTSGGCNDNQFCTTNDMCNSMGVCTGTPVPDQYKPFSGASIQVNLDQETLYIQSLLRRFFGAAGNNFQATFSMTGQTVQHCCENLKMVVPDSYSQFTASGGISTQKFFLPFYPWSIPFPGGGGGYGLYASFGLSLEGSVRFDDTMCAQMKCINGNITPQGTVTIGLGVEVNDPVNGSNLLAIGVSGSTGLNITIGPSPDCHSVTATIGINALNVTTYLSYEGGPQITGPVWTPVPAYTLPQPTGSFPLP